jgi:N,N'-diacetyllegionaminate synthase
MKPIIIAECCQNHNGDREILKKQIHNAKAAGADYVKIQAIRSNELSFRERFENGIIDENNNVISIKRPYDLEYERLKKLDLSIEDELFFVNECKSAGIKSMTTVFTISALEEIKNQGYDAVKIASYDCASYDLLKQTKKYFNKIFVSTGATYDNEIEEASKIMEEVKEFHFLHCLTIYPTPMNNLNLNRMNFLKKFTKHVGYSDHSHVKTTKLWASKIALYLGASCIERHFTILKEDKTKDGPVSINPSQLKELCDFAKLSKDEMFLLIKNGYPDYEKCLGSESRDLSKEELLNRDYYKGRFVSK